MIDVLGPEKRRRRTTQEKIAIVQQSFEPGMTVSLVARQHGVAASQLFLWRFVGVVMYGAFDGKVKLAENKSTRLPTDLFTQGIFVFHNVAY